MKTEIYSINEMTTAQLSEVAHAVQSGALVAIATDTVYGLAANAFEETAIARIYNIKKRPADMPLQILVDSTQLARSLVLWNESASQLAQVFWPGPLTMILPPNKTGEPLSRGFAGLGLRVPKHCGLLRFLSAFRRPLACTSANEHGRPVITTESELCDFCL
ncbi:MAG: L-threonylcarbamoyladenylate synthase, partial [Elusimicrobiaceae bacterium]|nr:L-threonylcarbamoyladenylate synthase [Elusimicrobiaceae bacterium]